MRGTRWTAARRSSPSGIIPALAGNTGAAGMDCLGCRDHPRACREHGRQGNVGEPHPGSSPRLRGTPHWEYQFGAGFGIIPALAGNTRACRTLTTPNRDHPRACGEHLNHACAERGAEGSSPRLRGTCRARSEKSVLIGIIPALAGNICAG